MAEPRRLRIAYLAGNDVVSDARVRKYVATAVAAGHEVTAFGVTRHGPGWSAEVAGAPLVVIGARRTFRERLAAVAGQLGVVWSWGYRDAEARVAARGQLARWRETAGRAGGWKRPLLALLAAGGGAWFALACLLRAPSRVVAHGPAESAELEALLASGLSWRDELPVLVKDETALGRAVDAWRPDVVHVHDLFELPAGAWAVARAAAEGRRVALVYDAHEYVRGLAHLPVRTVAAYTDLERTYLPQADRVVTVSDALADWLERDHALAERPLVVLNAPMTAAAPGSVTTLRQALGLAAEVPLLVYGGGVNAARGVDTAVRALTHLPGVHLAVVTNRINYVVRALLELAADLGVAERVHLADYVEPELVPYYFSDATIGLSTLLHSPNHDVALTNKFCEYLQAGLPIVTSDTPAQAALVDELDLGAVYPAGDVAGLASAVTRVLDDRQRWADRIAGDVALRRRFSWAAQAELVEDLYRRLDPSQETP